MRIKDVVTLRNEKTTDTSRPYIALENIVSWDAKFIESEAETEGTNNVFKKGDILFGKLRPYLAKGFCPSYDGICSTEFFVMRPKKDANPNYLLFYFLSDPIIDFIKNQVTGVKMPRTKWSDFGNIAINMPSLKVQQRIVEYLDEKLAKIDERIEVLEKQQDAYARLKKSVINQAVTRGLDPDVRLKDSGIEWIGKIPEHWEVKRFKEFASTTKGKQCDYYDSLGDNMAVVLTVDTLRKDIPSFYNYGYVEDKKQLCNETDIVVIWDGAGVGEFLKAKKGLLSSTIARIDINAHKVLNRYLWQWRYNIEYRLKQAPTGMGIPHLSPNLLNNYLIPIPPLSEQQAIASYLDEKCAKIDAAIENIGKQIDASKRLKRALINEVITGQRAV